LSKIPEVSKKYYLLQSISVIVSLTLQSNNVKEYKRLKRFGISTLEECASVCRQSRVFNLPCSLLLKFEQLTGLEGTLKLTGRAGRVAFLVGSQL